jgi:glycosyltransferase involved in cell wall biosynthesis
VRTRIGVNLLWLRPGEAGGAEGYTVRLLRALGETDDGSIDLVLLCNRRFREAHADLADRFEIAEAPIDGRSRASRIVAESTWVRRMASGLDLVHHTNDVVPWVASRPVVLTIHDLRSLELPRTTPRAQGAYLRSRLGPSVRHAAAIATPSASVRGSVIDRLGADPDRVRVVSAPVFPSDGMGADVPPVGRPFFLYPAATMPHKNHETLVEAFAGVVAERSDPLLILTGRNGPSEPSVAASIARHGLVGNVWRLGRVPAERLAALFREAVALTYPSSYEGFGLPVAEAMAHGCPVIASDATALPEVVGDAGILVEPGDVEGWTRAMLTLLEDGSERARLIDLGRERLRIWSPEAAVRNQLEVYRLALDRG